MDNRNWTGTSAEETARMANIQEKMEILRNENIGLRRDINQILNLAKTLPDRYRFMVAVENMLRYGSEK